MNPKLASLHPYPFQRLATLIHDITPAPKPAILLSVGEPKHEAPGLALEKITAHIQSVSVYPTTRGLPALRAAIAEWATKRYSLNKISLDPERHVLPACGTREALFSISQTVVNACAKPTPIVILPNPFYQIYEGAALLAGAEPYYLNTVTETGYKMDFASVPADIWKRTRLVYTCSPGNPTGAIISKEEYAQLIELAQRYDFVIASDECYSEIYFDEDSPPPGLLQIADELGIEDYRHCLVFNSLSKRSNLPGLRSGFIAGDGQLMHELLQYRTYHGCTVPSLTQHTSIAVWADEAHVRANRVLYKEKFKAVLEILRPVLPVEQPQAGFYLWLKTSFDDEAFTKDLFSRENVLVLPGSYLSRHAHGTNPGHNHVRMALVAGLDECKEAAYRMRHFIESL